MQLNPNFLRYLLMGMRKPQAQSTPPPANRQYPIMDGGGGNAAYGRETNVPATQPMIAPPAMRQYPIIGGGGGGGGNAAYGRMDNIPTTQLQSTAGGGNPVQPKIPRPQPISTSQQPGTRSRGGCF